MESLGVGIVGAGWMGTEHAIGWQNNAPRGRIVAVADVSPARAQLLADRYAGGQARLHPDLDHLLADPNVEAVDVCLPHHLHTGAILAAARAGKAVLCEKPLCTSLADAALIDAALRESGVPFMAAHNQLFQPSLVEARRLLATGVLGRTYVVRSIEAVRNRGFRTGGVPVELGAGENSWAWRADPERMGGGEVLDTGWHASYRLLALADDRPVAVTAMLGRFYLEELPAEDTGMLLVRFASGAIGEITTSWAFSLSGALQFEVAGELGTLAGSRTRLVHQLHGWVNAAEQEHEPVHTFTAEIGHFLDVVQRGVPCLASFAHAARVLQLTKAAYQSAAEGRTVALPENPLELAESAEEVSLPLASA